ncbi:MAG: hypothetical protein AB8B64_01350 [Granulosicoccus sp.]
MDDDSVGSVDSLVSSVIRNFRAQFVTLSTGAHLAWAEVRVVASHAGLLIGLVIVAAGLLLVGWALVLLTSAMALMNLGLTTIQALICTFLLNMIAFVALCLFMRHTLKAITFKHTRRVLGVETVTPGKAK